ncbi:MAG: AcrR family transcriptional regulator [Halioglobus sp.]|jgi:AcrR family transcriptional regulator
MNEQRKKQRRGEQTKRQMIDVTKSLLAKFDYQSITLEQIASKVGVSKSSILWHFGSKEGLLTEAVFDLFAEIDEKLMMATSDLETLPERLEFLLGSVGEYFETNPEAKGIVITLLFNSQIPSEIRDRIREQWRQHIQQIQDFLTVGEDSVSEKHAISVLAFMQGMYLHWHLDGCPPDTKAYLVESFQALADLQSKTV